MPKKKLNYQDRSNQLRTITKTSLNNNVTDCKGAVYVEIEIELS